MIADSKWRRMRRWLRWRIWDVRIFLVRAIVGFRPVIIGATLHEGITVSKKENDGLVMAKSKIICSPTMYDALFWLAPR